MAVQSETRVHAGEVRGMKNAMIRYILNAASKKTPFKSIDIVKQCLRNEQKWYFQLWPQVQEDLNDLFGLVIHEVKERNGKFYLVTSEFASETELVYTATQREELRLLLIVLSYIFMKGGKVLEPALFGFLKNIGLRDEHHEYFGNFNKLITETFVKQMYLKKEKIELESGNTEERVQFSWGHRAEFEFKKRDCLEFVATMMNRPPESFSLQYEECNSDTENMEIDD